MKKFYKEIKKIGRNTIDQFDWTDVFFIILIIKNYYANGAKEIIFIVMGYIQYMMIEQFCTVLMEIYFEIRDKGFSLKRLFIIEHQKKA